MSKWIKSWLAIGAIALGVLAGWPARSAAQPAADGLGAYRIETAPGTDESRFLMKFLTLVYRNWPTDPANGARAANWATDLPWQIERLASHAKRLRRCGRASTGNTCSVWS